MFILTDAAHSSGVLEGVVHLIVPEIIGLIEIMGIIVIIVGSIKGFYMYASSLISGKHYPIKLALGNEQLKEKLKKASKRIQSENRIQKVTEDIFNYVSKQ